jgi:hypothetical protein
MSTYITQTSDVGLYVRCVVTPTNAAGVGPAEPSNSVGPITTVALAAPANTTPPAITGTARVGSTLTVSTPGVYTGNPAVTKTYQWQRDTLGVAPFVNIAGQTAITHVLVDADDGCHVRAVETGSNGVGAPAVTNSNSIGVIQEQAPVIVIVPVASGVPTVGQTLTCTPGTWTGMAGTTHTWTYQWQRDVAGNSVYSNIVGATNPTYVLQVADIGCHVHCVVTAVNDS